MHERPGARAPSPWQAARARAHQRPGRHVARTRTSALAGSARARALAPGQAARAHTSALAGSARARAPAPWQAARARARKRPGRQRAHQRPGRQRAHQRPGRQRARARTSARARAPACTIVFPFACMPLALWGVVGLLVLILANGMAWLGLVPVLPTFSSYSLFDGIYYSDNRSNSRANTWNKPRLLEGMHLLDKRSTQALPVALMIHDNSSDRTAFVPAMHHSNFCPINFRCWTLGWVDRSASGVHRLARPFCRRCAPGLNWPGRASGAVTLKKLERTTAKAFAKDVFINQERKLGARRRSDTVLVSTINDADQGSADVAFRTPLAPYEKSKSLGSGGSMVARLKLKGIDGRAPPGVEPAA
ncbi:hypothetical protein VNO78_29213 [Psophocarpus tetragonolobus]|uniref:Uncharacterized protein n=1 Tax=Psophocarpus tetragonolobus TaxID=3891 RepID=A0AAN9X0L4_PSOTE